MSTRLEIALAAVLVAAGVASLAAQRWLFVDPTTPTDWADAAAWTMERLGEGDRVLVAPSWRDDALLPLKPVGAQVLRMHAPHAEDLYQFDNLLLIAERDRFEEVVARLPIIANVAERLELATVTAARLELEDDVFTWELYDELADLSVTRVRGDEVEVCERWDARRQRWDCGRVDRWIYVGQAYRELDDEPRRCVWAHPLDGGRTLRLQTRVPAARTLRIRDSFDLRGSRLATGADVRLRAYVDEQLVVDHHVPGNDQRWTAHDIDISGATDGVDLQIDIDLFGAVRDRFFCINAWTMP